MEVSQYKVSNGVGGTWPLNHEMHFSLLCLLLYHVKN